MKTFPAWLVRALAVAALTLAASAQAEPSRSPRTAEAREAVASLQRRLHALAGVERMTVQTAAEALRVTLEAPVQVHERRREWPIRPDAVLSGGAIIEAGSDILIKVKPSALLRLSFEDVAVVLMRHPYYLDPRQRHVDTDSVATMVYAIDHAFLVKAGEMRIQVPVTLPATVPEHGVKAIGQGYDQAHRASAAQAAHVDTIYFSTDLSRAQPAAMAKPLAERRRQRIRRAP